MPIQKQGITILIVDDDEVHINLYSWILEREGYACKSARVKSTSIEIPESNDKIDLILLDYRLNSSITPVEVAQRLRKTFGPIPIVVLSDLAWMPDDIREHAIDFISKGDPNVLLDKIAAVLERPS
jgi:CheY-like chemotaxis protein